jgi:uncharacterized membrane protein SpoIIM required for sporulation
MTVLVSSIVMAQAMPSSPVSRFLSSHRPGGPATAITLVRWGPISAQAKTHADTRREQLGRLLDLVRRAGRVRGLRGLSEPELLEFGRLYRYAAAELSHARTYRFDEGELARLNDLVGRAYALLYVSESSGWGGVIRFYRAELPRTLRRHGRLIALAAAIFLLGGLVGVVLGLPRRDTLALVSPQIADAIDQLAQRHTPGQDWLPRDFRPIASSLIMVNNVQVSFFAFSTGILLGLGTIYVLAFNGFMLGAIAAGITTTSAGPQFWAFVAPHGVLELPAIVISGAAGLLLGQALVDPGPYSRLDALRMAGRDAAVIMLGVVSFLAVAGVVEGFFSPAVMPIGLKFAAAAALAVAFGAYVLQVGRDRPAA